MIQSTTELRRKMYAYEGKKQELLIASVILSKTFDLKASDLLCPDVHTGHYFTF